MKKYTVKTLAHPNGNGYGYSDKSFNIEDFENILKQELLNKLIEKVKENVVYTKTLDKNGYGFVYSISIKK